MKIEEVIPPLRDVVCLALGGYSGYHQIVGTITWEGITLTLLLLAGPAAISAFWSARTPANGSSVPSAVLPSSPPSSTSSPSP